MLLPWNEIIKFLKESKLKDIMYPGEHSFRIKTPWFDVIVLMWGLPIFSMEHCKKVIKFHKEKFTACEDGSYPELCSSVKDAEFIAKRVWEVIEKKHKIQYVELCHILCYGELNQASKDYFLEASYSCMNTDWYKEGEIPTKSR